MTTQPSSHLEHAALLASSDPFFLAHLLAPLIQSGRITRRDLAAKIVCPESRLVRLWLCRAPSLVSPAFREDIERIANYVGCDPTRLGTIVREASAIKALESTRESSQSVLLAARDRLPEEPNESTKSDEES